MISTGSAIMDNLLDGGLDKDKVICIYGEAATGKTTFAMIAAIEQASHGKKVLFIDTENGFNADRFKQLSCGNLEFLNNVFVTKISSFYEQLQKVKTMETIFSRFSLIIIDTIGNFYRKEVVKDSFANNQLNTQMFILKKIAESNVPVLITNQVYTDPVDKTMQIVGGKIVKDNVNCLIELVKLNNSRGAVLRKHHVIEEQKEIVFKIVEKGFVTSV